MNLTFQDPDIFVAQSTFYEKEIPKQAGFVWDKIVPKKWATRRPEVAKKLIGHADGLAKAKLQDFAQKQEKTILASRATTTVKDFPCPAGLAYRPFQRAGIAYLVDHRNVLLADAPRVGKCIQGIGLINADETLKNILVICPASIRLGWKEELEKWLVRKLTIGLADTKEIPDTQIVICSWAALSKVRPLLMRKVWDLVIADESHNIKESKAQRTRALVGFPKAPDPLDQLPLLGRRNVFMTGTPFLNRPIEIWTTLHHLDPKTWTLMFQFAKRYCAATQKQISWDGKMAWDFKGASNLEELQERLRSTLMIRRTFQEVCPEMPKKTRAVIPVPPNGATAIVREENELWQKHEAALTDLHLRVEMAKLGESEEDYKKAVAALKDALTIAFKDISKARHNTAVATVPAVIEHLKTVFADQDEYKCVVFVHHHDVGDKIFEAFQDCAVLHRGGMPETEKKVAVDRFRQDPSIKLFVGSLYASSQGIPLDVANHIVFAELDWVPGIINQAEDRILAPGKTEPGLIQHIVLDGSLSARMAKRLVAKQEILDAALDVIPEGEHDDGEEPIAPLPVVDASVLKDARRAKLDAAAKLLTPDRILALHMSLKFLAARCDGARDLDGMGFNRLDSRIGKELAALAKLTPRQAVIADRLCTKYRGQLNSMGGL